MHTPHENIISISTYVLIFSFSSRQWKGILKLFFGSEKQKY